MRLTGGLLLNHYNLSKCFRLPRSRPETQDSLPPHPVSRCVFHLCVGWGQHLRSRRTAIMIPPGEPTRVLQKSLQSQNSATGLVPLSGDMCRHGILHGNSMFGFFRKSSVLGTRRFQKELEVTRKEPTSRGSSTALEPPPAPPASQPPHLLPPAPPSCPAESLVGVVRVRPRPV